MVTGIDTFIDELFEGATTAESQRWYCWKGDNVLKFVVAVGAVVDGGSSMMTIVGHGTGIAARAGGMDMLQQRISNNTWEMSSDFHA